MPFIYVILLLSGNISIDLLQTEADKSSGDMKSLHEDPKNHIAHLHSNP